MTGRLKASHPTPEHGAFKAIRQHVAEKRRTKADPDAQGFYALELPAEQYDALAAWIDADPEETFTRDGDALVVIGCRVTKETP